jgi:dolichol-phosphate mannosyltransferase
MNGQTDQVISMKSIKVICPVYNEELSLHYFYERYCAMRDKLPSRYDLELTFVNNGSSDRTLDIIKQFRAQDRRVQVISHSRNFGYQASVMCGLTNVKGDAYVVIDADCEDPPEMIPAFIEKMEEGYDLVYGKRRWRSESNTIVAARRLFYRLTNKIADTDFIIDMAEFALFTRRVRNQVLSHRSTFPFVRSDLAFAGFRRFGIDYKREPRRFGKTHYNLARMAQFAIGGILSASTFPLRASAYCGIPIMAADLLAAVLQLLGFNVRIAALALLNMAFICFSLAFLAIYIARIAKDVTARPIFIIDAEASEVNEPLVSLADPNSGIPKGVV